MWAHPIENTRQPTWIRQEIGWQLQFQHWDWMLWILNIHGLFRVPCRRRHVPREDRELRPCMNVSLPLQNTQAMQKNVSKSAM